MCRGSPQILYDLTHVFTYSEGVLDGEYSWNAEKRYALQVRVSVVHDGEGVFHIEAWAGRQAGRQAVKGR